MMNAIKICVFTVLVAAFYSYVSQMVPQTVTYPPEDTELGADMTTEDLVAAGEEIASGKGTCLTCHTVSGETGGRFPDLANIGLVAAERKEGFSDVEYLAESLYEPNEYIVEGFLPGMTPISDPPIDLNDQEILAVIAYLQSLGGAATVTLDTELRWQSEENAAGASTASQAGAFAAPSSENLSGEELFTMYACGTCHSLTDATPLLGPSLYNVGNELSTAEIYEAIMDPDAVVSEEFVAGLMTAQLSAVGFYDKISSGQLKTLVDYLASQKGGS